MGSGFALPMTRLLANAVIGNNDSILKQHVRFSGNVKPDSMRPHWTFDMALVGARENFCKCRRLTPQFIRAVLWYEISDGFGRSLAARGLGAT